MDIRVRLTADNGSQYENPVPLPHKPPLTKEEIMLAIEEVLDSAGLPIVDECYDLHYSVNGGQTWKPYKYDHENLSPRGGITFGQNPFR